MEAGSDRTDSPGRPSAAVLAGGRGSRLGGSKAMVELRGRPLIDYPLSALEEAGLEPLVVAKPDSELPPLSCRVIREPLRPRHPLCGIVAALREAGGRAVIAVGCDMPFVPPALLDLLASAPQPLVVPSIAAELQPLPARYGGALLPALEEALARAEPLRRTVESLQPSVVDEDELVRLGEPRRLCFNVNTPLELKEAERLLETVDR